MLAEERYSKILAIVERDGSATVQQLMAELETSESTIRRDLNSMDSEGLLSKVHGGAIANSNSYSTLDEAVNKRKELHHDEKQRIAKYAALLIKSGDFVYLDAGTTTELMIDYICTKDVTFVTNSLNHAKKLSDKGYKVYILGGEFKSSTEAVVGEEAVETLDKYNFTKGFWGTNGVSEKNGYTTPGVKEALVKKKSMSNCKERYVLADSSKFFQISSVKFAEFGNATVITDCIAVESLRKFTNIKEV